MKSMPILFSLILLAALALPNQPADAHSLTKRAGPDKFRVLESDIATPNVYRNAMGAPGPQYWQQQADYKIRVSLDTENKKIKGSEQITYSNNSPHTLNYLWLQMEQNRLSKDSLAQRSNTAEPGNSLSYQRLRTENAIRDHDFGYKLRSVKTAAGKKLEYTIVDTMMRVDLPTPLKSGEQFVFDIIWEHDIINRDTAHTVFQHTVRSGYERFENDTYQYFMAAWFPRMAALTDYTGWQTKAFLGNGEFALEFGNYEVEIDVPDNHIVAATGELQNADDVLTDPQRNRLKKARNAKKPVFIVSPEEAAANEKTKANGRQTWRFSAENVRDFAWASSPTYIWDAMGHKQDSEEMPLVMAMSYYPNQGNPLWSQYSTHAVAHTMEVYSEFSFPYPYPVAISLNAYNSGGMEYPMISFNGSRPEKDQKLDILSYDRRTKEYLIVVILHEIGHIYFPMLVNSDERQWAWLDEGINTFLHMVAIQRWDERFLMEYNGFSKNPLDLPSDYMQRNDIIPLMNASDDLPHYFANSYLKPAAALIVLRETILGRELFDFAFRTYAQRWLFKRPTPADFFRTMEDASGMDLDWFWQGWFYGTDHVDISVADFREYTISSRDPDIEYPKLREKHQQERPEPISILRNREEGKTDRASRYPELDDFYSENDPYTVSNADRNKYQGYVSGLKDWEKQVLDRALADNDFIYFAEFANVGGLISPLPVTLHHEDGSTTTQMIPAEIWRQNNAKVSKMFITEKKVTRLTLDDRHQTADVDMSNNAFPRGIPSSRLELKSTTPERRNLMRDMQEELEQDD